MIVLLVLGIIIAYTAFATCAFHIFYYFEVGVEWDGDTFFATFLSIFWPATLPVILTIIGTKYIIAKIINNIQKIIDNMEELNV